MPDEQQAPPRPAPPFRVRTSGHICRQAHHSTPGTKQGDVMLTVVLSGRGFYVLDGRRTIVQKGMIGLVCGAEPGILLADPGDPYDHYYCRFSGDHARLLAGEIVEREGRRFFVDDRCEQLAELLHRMGSSGRALLPERMGTRELLLAEALVLLSGREPAAAGPRLTTNSLRNHLLEHVSEPFELARVAGHFGISRAALCRAARRVTGRTVLDIAEELKVEWARTLLASGVSNVSETARRVGYADPFYFSRVFKKRTGRSPRAWMKRRERGAKRERGHFEGDRGTEAYGDDATGY